MKSYTDIEQSKKLAEILPLESADMRFCFSHRLDGRITGHYPMIGREPSMGTIACWSLAALLSVLPQSVRLVGTPKDSYWYCECVNGNSQWYAGFESADNPVDACVGMIIKLHELKRL